MKKPFNKFAILLWVLAVLVPTVIIAGRLYLILGNIPPADQAINRIFASITVAAVISQILTAFGQLAALAVLIELIDQLRWNAIQNRTIH